MHVHNLCTCTSELLNRVKLYIKVFNEHKPNKRHLVPMCPAWSQCVPPGPNASRLVPMCPTWSQCVPPGPNVTMGCYNE